MRQYINDQKDYWRDFYRRNFFIEVDFSGMNIPEFDNQRYYLVIVAAGLFFQRVIDVAGKTMNIKIEDNLTFGGKVASIREAEADYFVLVSRELTKLNFCSGPMSFRAENQITLTECFLCMMMIFEKNFIEFSNLLLSIFICGASRLEGKRNILLPGLVYDKNSKIIHIIWYDGFYAENNIDKLEIFSF